MPRNAYVVAGGLFATLALAACGGGSEAPGCENPVAATTVTMDDFSYEPGCVEASSGTELDIVNDGQAPHTFTIEAEAEAADADVAAGEHASLAVPDLAPGTYRVVCTYHPQMEAALRIA
ncbi:MAG: cupredoxin domain-containing protein [Actinomycetota bacterium]